MDDSLISVGALHALAYCERLFYLEEVERIRVADAAVYAGRRLHVELDAAEDEGTWSKSALESETLGICGSVDVLRRRDGQLVPYEHKRGRAARPRAAGRNVREAWATDRLQVGAYAMLVEESHGKAVPEGRVRYHADGVTVRVPIDDILRADVRTAVTRARELRAHIERPPVTPNERLCVRCSLAPVCLPEEVRLARDESFEPVRLLPRYPAGKVVHVLESGTRVGRSGDQLVVEPRDGAVEKHPIAEVGSVVLHGFSQISTQALRLCADRDVAVHWTTFGGALVGSLAPSAASAQRHLRQFQALSNSEFALSLARKLVRAKLEGQLRFVLRATRESNRNADVLSAIGSMREALRRAARADSPTQLLGVEGSGAAAYFGVLPELLAPDLEERLRFSTRSRRPPRDRFNALLGYAYGMLYREALGAIIAVGLHPGVGFYHRPRSAAHTLALDLMELFRVPLADMPIVAALNRRSFDADADFVETPGRIDLSDAGRRKLIELIERRKVDTWKHSAVGYSLSYVRMIELEVRLLEKEWMGEGGLFARFRLR